MQRKDQREPRHLREVEVAREITEYRHVLAHRRPGIGAAIGARIESLAVEEIIFDELRVGIEAQDLMVDVAPARRTG